MLNWNTLAHMVEGAVPCSVRQHEKPEHFVDSNKECPGDIAESTNKKGIHTVCVVHLGAPIHWTWGIL